MIMCIVAFDYDGVLTNKKMQDLAKKLVRERNEIWVVTARRENEFNKNELKPVLKSIGLTDNNVCYCGDRPKLEMLQIINADMYIDNDDNEFHEILNYSNVIPLLFSS